MRNKPRISVVTVVRNGEDTIAGTIESVLCQDYPDLEYIIIDGNSNDRTLARIAPWEKKIAQVISEPDAGIFDAMNKGVKIATGEWINFMNSGDRFYTPTVVSDIFSESPDGAELIFGGCEKQFQAFSRIQKPGELKDLWKTTIFWHQSLFTRIELLRETPFNIRRKMTADYEFTLNMYFSGKSFFRSEKIISTVSAGGVSDVNRMAVISERYDEVKKYKNDVFMKMYYQWHKAETMAKSRIKKMVPEKLVEFIVKRKKATV